MTNEEKNKEQNVIEIEDLDLITELSEGETPVISIEYDDDDEENPKKHRCLWPWIVGTAFVTAIICAAVVFGYRYYKNSHGLGIPVSCSSAQNIEKLKNAQPDTTQPQVVVTKDTVNGIALTYYELRGLKAEIQFSRPQLSDSSVYLYCRSSNFTDTDPATNAYYGELVVNGTEQPVDDSRHLVGYGAMAGNNFVIGVAQDDSVMDYCIKEKGCFFRQYVLISANVLTAHFHVQGNHAFHALARFVDENSVSKLYYVSSDQKVYLKNFAKALYVAGATDAIYMPGHDEYGFYRTQDGQSHEFGNLVHKTEPELKVIPWLVFKKK